MKRSSVLRGINLGILFAGFFYLEPVPIIIAAINIALSGPTAPTPENLPTPNKP